MHYFKKEAFLVMNSNALPFIYLVLAEQTEWEVNE